MVVYKEQRVQRELNFAVVDEVDSILIDEARTPLIISGEGKNPQTFTRWQTFVKTLKQDVDFTVDEKSSSVILTDEGVAAAENSLE